MARNHTGSRRIFGGLLPQLTGVYSRELLNPGDQAVAESLAVGTHRRVFPGPGAVEQSWSYHLNPVSAAGATSALNFFYSNLPNPDPTVAAHWVDSGITAINLTVTTPLHGTVFKSALWIKAEAVIVTSAGTLWMYVRSSATDV